MTHPLCEEEIPYLTTFIVFDFYFVLDILTDKTGKVNTIFAYIISIASPKLKKR